MYQALFIAPCSHIFHFKCIRPLLVQHHPGFSCPLCRTFADLEADVEQDDVAEPVAQNFSSSGEEDEEEEEEEQPAARPSADEQRQPVQGASSHLPPDAGNLDTLRPGKRLAHVPSSGRPGESPRASIDSSRPSAAEAAATGLATPCGWPSSSSNRRDPSVHRMSSPAASLSPAAGSPGADFHPPSAGDFEADIRRSSIFVQGADGLASVIPITGRSRPGSVYEADLSDSNIALGAAANGTPTSSAERANRARSVKSLRMSTNSIPSLRQAANAAADSQNGESSNAAVAMGENYNSVSPIRAEAAASIPMTHPGRVGSVISQYHDLPDSDEEEDVDNVSMALDDPADGKMSPPGTARLPQLSLQDSSVPAPSSVVGSGNYDSASPASLFTAPMSAGTSTSAEPFPVGAASIVNDSHVQDEQATTPPSSHNDSSVAGGDRPKGKAISGEREAEAEGRVAATLPGGLEDMESSAGGKTADTLTTNVKSSVASDDIAIGEQMA